jgi:hypothetical protein
MFLLFSHKLTDEQINDAKKSLGVNEFIYLPQELQDLWSKIPANIDSLNQYLTPLKTYLKHNANKNDYVLIQGDFGAVYEMVNFAKSINLVPIYATTKRETKEQKQQDRIVKTSIFKHIRYRKY